jgi:drug/metabolite transporter (DMT)-like permease
VPTRDVPASSDGAPLQVRLAGVVPLGAYVLLRGLDATVLKGLQQLGAQHAVGGENPISFCNVFFVATLAIGLAALPAGGGRLGHDLARLDGRRRTLLALGGGLGLFLGPIASYMALQSLTVVSHTLLFSLVLPASALLARGLLAEPLPAGFPTSAALIGAGLLLPGLERMGSGPGAGGPALSLTGVLWALAGVAAFAGAGVCGRSVARRGWSPALAIGLPALVSALAFGLLALVLFGPGHFFLLQLWWVVGVIGVYAVSLGLGRELSLRRAYRHCGVATVSLWGSLAIVVATGSAVLLLGERIGPVTIAGLALVLIGTLRSPLAMRSDATLRGYTP